jgi:hypothetical protein
MKRIHSARHLALVFLLVAAISCGRFEDIRINSCKLDSASPHGLTAVDAVLDVEIDNPATSFTISDIQGVVLQNGTDSLLFITGGPVDVQRRSVQSYKVPCTASLGRNVGLFDLLNVVNSKNYEGYTLELEMEVSLKNGISRKVKLDPFKVEDLLNGFQDE